jgi:hypothetical protein
MPSNTVNSAALKAGGEESTLVGIEIALAQMPGGPTLEDKGAGVQHVRDTNGKITDVIVFFDDKVPQSDRAAALDKIQNNSGVATVAPKEIRILEDFDTMPVGLWHDLKIPGSGSMAPSPLAPAARGIGVGSDLRFIVDDTIFFSSPNSLKVESTGASATTWALDAYAFNLDYPHGKPIVNFKSGFRFRFPVGFLTGPATKGFTFELWDADLLFGGHNTRTLWKAVMDPTTPPTEIAYYTNTPWVGTVQALPVDDAWHQFEWTVIYDASSGLFKKTTTLDGASQTQTLAPFGGSTPAIQSPFAVSWLANQTGGAAIEYFHLDDLTLEFDFV